MTKNLHNLVPAEGGQTAIERGLPVPSVGFDYEAVFEPDDGATAPIDTPDLLRLALFLVMGESENGARVRAAAIATIAGYYVSPSEAARACHVNRSTMLRAVDQMRSALQQCNIDLFKKPQ